MNARRRRAASASCAPCSAGRPCAPRLPGRVGCPSHPIRVDTGKVDLDPLPPDPEEAVALHQRARAPRRRRQGGRRRPVTLTRRPATPSPPQRSSPMPLHPDDALARFGCCSTAGAAGAGVRLRPLAGRRFPPPWEGEGWSRGRPGGGDANSHKPQFQCLAVGGPPS